MKPPKRLFKRPRPEDLAKLEADADEAAKNLPSRHPGVPAGYRPILDALAQMVADLENAAGTRHTSRDELEEVLVSVVFARNRGLSLDAHLFEEIAKGPPIDGVDDAVIDAVADRYKRTATVIWRVLDDPDSLPDSVLGD